MRSWFAAPVLLAACMAPLHTSSAACTNAGRAALWTATDEPIPVYVNWDHATNGLSNLAYEDASFDQDSMELYVQAAITQINEAGSGADLPPLVFAGWLDSATTSSANRPDRSVVLHTSGCSTPCGNTPACTSTVADRFRIDLHEGATRTCGGDLHWTVHPSDDPDIIDLQGTIAHELMHALGMGHSNDPTCDADAGWNETFWTNGDVQNSVMAVPLTPGAYSTGWYRLRRRTLQRDDFQGLRHFAMYSQYNDAPLLHTSTDGTNWSADPGPAGWSGGRNIALSSAGGPGTDFVVAAWSDNVQNITWAVREADGTWSAPRGCSSTDPTSCDTEHPPAVAALDGRSDSYMVAWVAGELTQFSLDVLRFEIIDRSTGAVLADKVFGWHFDHYSRSMGVGTNPHEAEYIVAALAEYNILALQSFDTSGTMTGFTRYMFEGDVRPHEIGDPVCTDEVGKSGTQCLVPVTTEGVDGLCAGYLAFEHGAGGFFSLTTELHEDCGVRITGRPELAAGFGKRPSYLLAGAQPLLGEFTDVYGLWTITDPLSAVSGSHGVLPNPGPANRYRAVGSLVDGNTTQWFVADGHRTP